MGKGRRAHAHGGGKKNQGGHRGYNAVVSTQAKYKPEDDAELVKTSTNWNGSRGLNNLGNTCFFNSILQNLVQTIPLRTHLVPRDPLNPTEVSNLPRPTEGAVSVALRSTLVQMWLGAQRTYDPSLLFNAIAEKVRRFRSRQQQDSHELLRYLMDEVDTETLAILKLYKQRYLGKPMPPPTPAPDATEAAKTQDSESNGSDSSPLSPSSTDAERPLFTLDLFVRKQRGNLLPNEGWNLANFERDSKSGLVTYIESIFGGRVESTLMCHACGATSSTFETFLDLSVPIPVRFLDERIKRAIGLLPSLKQSAKNVKFSAPSKSQQKRSNKDKTADQNVSNPFGDLETQDDEDEVETVSYKTDYDCETLSSIGSSSKRDAGKKKNDTSNSPAQVKLTLQQATLKVKTKLAAMQQKEVQGDGDAKKGKKPTPKKLNKRDRKAAKRREEADKNTLELPSIDISHLTEAQIMQLALADESQDLELMIASMTNGTSNNEETNDEDNNIEENKEKTEIEGEKSEDKNATGNGENSASVDSDASLDSHQDSNKDEVAINGDENPEQVASAEKGEIASSHASVENGALDSVSSIENKDTLANDSESQKTTENGKSDENSSSDSAAQESPLESSISDSANTLDTASELESSTDTTVEKLDTVAKTENSENDAVPSSSEPSEASEGQSHSSSEKLSNGPPEVPPKPQSVSMALNPNLKHDVRTVSRPAGLTIDACLYEFTEPEILSGANAYGCYECTKRLFLKEGRDLAPLIRAYGTDEEKKALQVSSGFDSSAPTQSSSSETKAEKVDEISADVSSLLIEPESAGVGSKSVTAEEEKQTPTEKPTENCEEESVEEKKDSGDDKAKSVDSDHGEEDGEDASSDEDSEDSDAPEVEKSEEEKAMEAEKKKAKEVVNDSSLPLVKSLATKQILIDEVPQVLTLHLKRFWTTMSGSAKLDHKVEFPTILDLAPYLSRSARSRFADGFEGETIVDSDGNETNRKPKNHINLKTVKYQLYGIVVHSGSMSGGHYVAYTRRRDVPFSDVSTLDDFRSGWNYYSDSTVSNATLESVLSQQAYILFYERVAE